jgi:hypothetical protein
VIPRRFSPAARPARRSRRPQLGTAVCRASGTVTTVPRRGNDRSAGTTARNDRSCAARTGHACARCRRSISCWVPARAAGGGRMPPVGCGLPDDLAEGYRPRCRRR